MAKLESRPSRKSVAKKSTARKGPAVPVFAMPSAKTMKAFLMDGLS